ncbi:MAG: hypothetical protein AAF570_08660, partial [Bacteroidota bacterium]
MRIKSIIVTCACLFLVLEAISQVHYIDSRVWKKDTWIDSNDPLEFQVYPYTGPMLNLIPFKVSNPNVPGTIPDYMAIAPPSLEGMQDPVVAIAYVGVAEEPENGMLIVIFVGNYNSARPWYYVDYNMNRVFSDDGAPIIFNPNGLLRKRVTLKDTERSGKNFSFYLLSPGDVEFPTTAPPSTTKTEPDPNAVTEQDKPKVPVSFDARFAINVGIDIGVNRVEYRYRDPATQYGTTYEVTNHHKGLRLGMTYRYGGLRFGITASLEHLLWWSSYRSVRVADPATICDSNGENCQFVSGLEVNVNRDQLPELRLTYGATLGYLFKLRKNVRFGPYLQPAVTTFS